jgi:putative endonuclease
MNSRIALSKSVYEDKEQNAHVYIARCNDGSLYTGWARDVNSRITAHNSGKGAKYTRSRMPVTLAASWSCGIDQARKLEVQIKRLSKTQKEKLISLRSTAKTSLLTLLDCLMMLES